MGESLPEVLTPSQTVSQKSEFWSLSFLAVSWSDCLAILILRVDMHPVGNMKILTVEATQMRRGVSCKSQFSKTGLFAWQCAPELWTSIQDQSWANRAL